eukprot:756410-Hanusia_phi.AAC.4
MEGMGSDNAAEQLLGKIKFDFTTAQEKILIDAFKCEDCWWVQRPKMNTCDCCHSDETTTCHQIRAVYDAFHLSWDGDASLDGGDGY